MNKQKNSISYKQAGFTLIELLVVIAIIGILSSVVLASLNSARNKGADAAVKANLANARVQADLFYYENTNKYVVAVSMPTDVCYINGSVGNPAIKGIYSNVLAAAKATGLSNVNAGGTTAGTLTTATCHSTTNAWAAEAPLKSDTTKMWCVDSTGFSGQTTGSTLPANNFACN